MVLLVAIAVLFVALGGFGVAAVLSRTEWAKELDLAIATELPWLSNQARALMLAHAAYESDFGTGYAARHAYNPWNVTAGRDGSPALEKYLAAGGKVLHQENADWEYDSTGQRYRIAQNWRAFGNWREAVADYWRNWMLRPTYAPARAALERADLESFVRELRGVRYFSLPVEQYITGLRRAAEELSS